MNTDGRWSITRTRHIPAVYPLLAFFDWKCAEYFGLDDSGHVINVWDKGDYFAIWEKQKLGVEFADHALQMLLKISDISEIRSQSDISGKKLIEFCKGYALNEGDLTIDGHIAFLKKLSVEYANLMRDNMCYWLFAPAEIERKLRVSLKRFTEDESAEIIGTLSHSEEESYSQKIDKEFSYLVDLARNDGISDEKLIEKVVEFSAQYSWFPYEYVGPDVWDEKAIINKIKHELSNPHDIQNAVVSASHQHKAVISKYKLNPEELNLFSLWQMMSLLQDDRKMYNAQVSYYINDVIARKAVKSFSINFEQARYLDKEVLIILNSDRVAFEVEMRKRIEFFIVDQKNSQYISHSSGDAQKYLLSLEIKLKDEVSGVKEFKGHIAYKGKVTGRVRVLKTSQVSDFTDGDIIVTGMTTPDFAPLMKKASAIITNEGGITCHAAIVSRELKKPCIIGTKIATQILKDGDMVEVDADKGIVRIIK